jgi:hypothetical protein
MNALTATVTRDDDAWEGYASSLDRLVLVQEDDRTRVVRAYAAGARARGAASDERVDMDKLGGMIGPGPINDLEERAFKAGYRGQCR